MSVDQITPRRAPRPSDDAKLVQYDQYIDTHIRNTRRAVKAVDWATALVLLATGVIAFLLTAAVVEHWFVPGGFSVGVRMALFALLVGGVGSFAYRRLWPLCRRAINPVYAAQTIERSSPTLKNSLINLLLFRQHRTEISDAVYQTLEEQAAQRLTRVPVDAAVDRSHLIRFGYVLIAVVAVAALYKVLSPKDPWIAAERILMPWSDIVPASRVSIRDVEPGSLTVSRGEFINVSAEIRDLDEDEPVLLRYTTDDGQAVDKPIPMRLARDGLRFEGRLPDAEGTGSKIGVAQNLRYRIEAGDARTRDYDVKVVAAPSILVDRVEYDYPEYTGYIDRTVEELGDIRAIEGTRITVHARANGPIEKAHVDFDADGRTDLAMTATGSDAQASFVLALREDRQTPQHVSYVLRFTSADGRPNRSPVKHPIVVDPDLAPEVAIRLPQEKTLDVRLNDTIAIEAEAGDPDFALADVRLHGEVAGQPVLDEPLLNRQHTGPFTGRYQFTPSAHDLRAGDVVQYWIAADDNRAPQPNTTESERRRIRITSPDPAQQPPPDRIAQSDRPQQQRNPQQPGGAENQQFSRDAQPSAEPGQAVNESTEPNEGQGQASDEQQQQGENAGEQSQPQNQPGGAAGTGEQSDSTQQSGDENQSGDSGRNGQRAKPGEQNSDGKQTGAGAAGGESSQQGSQPDGARPDESATARSENGSRRKGGPAADETAEPAPISSEGDNDAEAFERIQKHLERSGELNGTDSPADDRQFSRDAQRSAEQQQGQRQGDKETGRQGEKENKPQAGDTDDSSRAQQPGSQEQNDDGKPSRGESPEQPGTSAKDRGEGAGAETRQDDLKGNETQPDNTAEQSESPGGQQTSSKGPSGAGREQESQGAPNSDPNLKPTEKRQQSGSDAKQSDQEEPSAGASGKRESDSQGEEGGDQAGGGEEGGGQKAPREGTGSAGQNQSADEGAGESAEKGVGHTSPNAGDDAQADRRTGQPGGETAGRGSKRREGEGDQPGGEAGVGDDPARSQQDSGVGDDPARSDADGEQVSRDAQRSAEQQQRRGDKETGRQGETDPEANKGGERKPGQAEDSSSPERGNQPGGEPGGVPTGEGGLTGTNTGPASTTEGVVPDGDAANLDYARKQTDLVLEKLSDQLKRKRVGKDLLDQLGWTEDDLRKFVERWQERKQAAQRNDPAGEAARRELDDALRSLGLRRGTLRQGPVKDDMQRDLREGYRGPVPAQYQERLRAYNQGVSRARQDGK